MFHSRLLREVSQRVQSNPSPTYIVKLDAHAVVDLVVGQGDVVFERVVPFLQNDLARVRAGLGCNKLLEVANRIVGRALMRRLVLRAKICTTTHLDAHFLAQPIIADG